MSVILEMNGLFESMGQNVTYPHISRILQKHAEKQGIDCCDILSKQLEEQVDGSEAASLADSLFKLAQTFYGKGDYEAVFEILCNERVLRSYLNDPSGEVRLLNLRLLAQIEQDRIGEALESCDEAVALADKHGLTGAKARILFNMGSFLETCDSEDCTGYLKEALSLSNDSGNTPGVAYCCNALSRYYRKNRNPEAAYNYSLEAVGNSIEGHGSSAQAQFLFNLAIAERDTGKLEEAITHIEEAEKVFPQSLAKEKCIWAEMTSGKASILMAMNCVDQAESLLSGLSGYIDKCNTDVEVLYYSVLFSIKNERNLHREALEAFEKLVELRKKDQDGKLKTLVKLTVEERHLNSRKREKEMLSRKNDELTESNKKLNQAISEAETLSEFLPICSHCGKVRTDEGYWEKLADYLAKNSGTTFAQSLCGDCKAKHDK